MMHSVRKRPQTAAQTVILYYEGMVLHVEDESKRQNRAVLLQHILARKMYEHDRIC